jgi:hypothetical protein
MDSTERLINHHSSYYRLKKAYCWLLRFKNHILKKPTDMPGYITVSELNQAENYIFQYVQRQRYSNEIERLNGNKAVKKSSPIIKLSPKINDGLLVVGGRLKHAHVAATAKHPVILPADHKVFRMIVEDYHYATHLGTEWTHK